MVKRESVDWKADLRKLPAPPRHAHGDLTSLAPNERLPEILVVPRATWVRYLGWEDHLEKGKATHSSILAWRIPWTV